MLSKERGFREPKVIHRFVSKLENCCCQKKKLIFLDVELGDGVKKLLSWDFSEWKDFMVYLEAMIEVLLVLKMTSKKTH